MQFTDKFWRLKYPNPCFIREDFELLNGEWEFDFDDEMQLTVPVKLSKKIIVPYSYETLASGIHDTRVHPVVWYQRKINLRTDRGRILLHFEAVDYECTVFLNNREIGTHQGGYTAFFFDITPFAKTGENLLTVCVSDSLNKSQLRGKQRARHENYDCWYVQTTGIWKNVWLEYAGSEYLKSVQFDPKIDGKVTCQIEVSGGSRATLKVGNQTQKAEVKDGKAIFEFKIDAPMLWEPENPFLYDAEIILEGDRPDKVRTYFGFREVACKEDGVYLNGKKVYLKMILDQGYWEETMLTAPDTEALVKDIEYIIAFGFNGVRKHQKIENYSFYHLCDLYGLLVWAEIPSAYEFDERMKTEFRRDSLLILKQLHNFLSIIVWVIFNESWGIPQIKDDHSMQEFAEEMKALFRKKCGNRLLTVNDGWHQLDGDILSLHEYEQDAEVFAREYADKDYVLNEKIINDFGKVFVEGKKYSGQPIIISEFGGISISGSTGWGYGKKAENDREFLGRFAALIETLENLNYVSGYCYTQLTDVQQEVNGLLTSKRVPKIDPGIIRDIING